MKMKKYLLPGMMATLMFAACTNEELVSQQAEAPEVDLSNRPMVGHVDLNFGPQTRLGLDELAEEYNAIEWKVGDVMGARLIDQPNKNNYKVHSLNYSASDYAYTNYKYTRKADGNWTTDALLVEGNYMMYLPYDETARGRNALEVEFPIVQNIDTKSELKDGANRDAIRDLYNDGWKFGFGHIFVDATKTEFDYGVNYGHFYAHPQITLKNSYTTLQDVVENGVSVKRELPADLTISKIEIAGAFYQFYTVNHTGIIDAMQDAVVEEKDGRGNIVVPARALGSWRNAYDALYNKTATANVLTENPKQNSQNGKITVMFEPALVIAKGESYKLNLVMPAATYAVNSLSVTVYGSESTRLEEKGKEGTAAQFKNANVLTYVPGKRFPREEYNFEGGVSSLKDTKGTLATFELKGDMNDFTPTVNGIQSLDQFITEVLVKVEDNTDLIEEGEGKDFTLAKKDNYAMMKMNKDLIDALNKYLDKGSIKFITPMLVEGDVTISNNVDKGCDIISLNGLKQTSGTLTLTGTTIYGGAEFTDVVLSGATFNDNVVLKGKVSGSATFQNVTSEADGNLYGTINGKLTVNSGELTVGTSANGAEIKGGTVTVSGNLNAIEAYGATLNLNVKNYASQITLGKDLGSQNGGEKAATLNINMDQSALNVAIQYGSKVVNNNVTAFKSLNWVKGTLTNKKTINSDLEVKGTYNHGDEAYNKNISVTGTVKVAENATVNNWGEITVAENNGTIVTKDVKTYTTVSAGSGEIDNTVKAALSASGHTVYVKGETIDNAEIFAGIDAAAGINKLIVTGLWSVTQNVDLSQAPLNNITTIEFEGGDLNVQTATLTLAPNTKAIISGASDWTGRDATVSKIANLLTVQQEVANTTTGALHAWTVNRIDLGDNYVTGVLANGGTLNLLEDTDIECATIAAGKKVIINLNGFDITAKEGTGLKDILFRVDGELEINGEGNVNTKDADCYVASANEGGKITVNGGNYTSATTCFQSNGGEVIINDGEFNAWDNTYMGKYTVNYIDAYKNSGLIKIYEGTFHKFNPLKSNGENPIANLVDDDSEVNAWVNGVVDNTYLPYAYSETNLGKAGGAAKYVVTKK